MEKRLNLACSVLLAATFGYGGEESSKVTSATGVTFNGLALRSIGPALTSGRIPRWRRPG